MSLYFIKKMRENFVFRFGVFDIFRMRGDFVGTLDLQMGRDKKHSVNNN